MIDNYNPQCAAISPAWMPSMANEEIASTVAYRVTAPAGMRLQGISVPSGANALKGTGAPGAGFQWSGVAQIQADRTTVVDRGRLASVPGPVPRGRPV